MGFPVINVTRDQYEPTIVHTEQKRFLVHSGTQSPSDDA